MDVLIRPMSRGELPFAIGLAEAEGWNPGLHDASCFHAADPGGYLVAVVDGDPVGCISAVRYGQDFGFIGLYIVIPSHRGLGIGRRLWDGAMQRLQGRLVGLDGVPAQQPFYRRSGFELAWQNMRFEGTVPATHAQEPPQVVPLPEVDVPTLVAYDRAVFPAPREAFLRHWAAMPDAVGLAWREEGGGPLAGWGLARACAQGFKVGPLFADTPAIARALFEALRARLPSGERLYLDVPLPHAAAQDLAAGAGMRGTFETARMYTGASPATDLDRVFGITTFELG